MHATFCTWDLRYDLNLLWAFSCVSTKLFRYVLIGVYGLGCANNLLHVLTYLEPALVHHLNLVSLRLLRQSIQKSKLLLRFVRNAELSWLL